MCRRVLQVGFGRIGREVFGDYRSALATETFMVADPAGAPEGYEWDGQPVDVAVVIVDTPAKAGGSGLDCSGVVAAVGEYLELADFVVVRSTVGLDFLGTGLYLAHGPLIGFSPEFYGTTSHSRRGMVNLDFSIFSDNVPEWFADLVCVGKKLVGPAREVIVAKLTENAFLATKVTFFHELALTCRDLGLSFDTVRELVTADPRINPYHSYCDELGWSSHCFDKDVPAFARLSFDTQLVSAALAINRQLLVRR